MISAQTNDLSRAFNIHKISSASLSGPSNFLLLFYAVESGLKYVYLRKNGLKSTDDLDDPIKEYGHDITLWLSELKIPAHRMFYKKNFRLRKKIGSNHVRDIHQAWRYGILIHEEDERDIISFLHNLEQWIEENK